MRAQIDEDLQIIAQLELFLEGEEMQYPAITNSASFGDSSRAWKHEWPSRKDLEKFDILTVQQELQLSTINIKKSNEGNAQQLVGI